MYIYAGDNRLSLQGLPRQKDCLLESVLCQLFQSKGILPDLLQVRIAAPSLRSIIQLFVYEQSLTTANPWFWTEFGSDTQIGDYHVVRALSQCLNVTIEVYTQEGDKRIYPSPTSAQSTIHLFRYEADDDRFYYDSILDITPSLAYSFTLGTWNLSGAATIEKRMAIDHLAVQHRIDILSVQETHLHSQDLVSEHYHWYLGSQVPGRASRGCGFLVRKTFPFPVSDNEMK